MTGFVLDIDGVLADTELSLKQRVVEKLGIPAEKLIRNPTYNNMYRHDEIHEDDLDKIVYEVYSSDHGVYTDAEVMPYSHLGVETIHRFGLLKGYVTRRFRIFHETTHSWLKHHGFPMDVPLICCMGKESKAEYMDELGASFIIEDSPKEIEDISGRGKNVLIMDQIYNKDVLESALKTRYNSWYEILEDMYILRQGRIPAVRKADLCLLST